jgi:hypothetical protein
MAMGRARRPHHEGMAPSTVATRRKAVADRAARIDSHVTNPP